jgi:5-formyltetrahydrofolate cyclo-ligase
MEKDEIREKIWRMMVEKKVALPPFPVHGRIPNFKGAREAAMRLRNLDEYRKAEVLLCNPDSPQIHVREMALKDGKILVVATPRLSRGFIEVRGQDISPTIRGMIERGRPVKPGDHKIDIFVAGICCCER